MLATTDKPHFASQSEANLTDISILKTQDSKKGGSEREHTGKTDNIIICRFFLCKPKLHHGH
jgi:hypothetical protein